MTKNFLEQTSRIALFRDQETEPGEPSATAGVSIDFDSGSGINSAAVVEHDGDSIHGAELPGNLHCSHREAQGTLSQKRAKPDFIAFVLAYFFGECDSTSVGTTAYRHDLTPVSGLELPSFTAVQRKGSGVFAERLAGDYLESFNIEIGDGWVSCSADVVGTGHREVNYEHEILAAPANATNVTLDSNAVEGDTDAERLANVYRVRAKDLGAEVWEVLTVTTVSDATPAVISFETALGTGTSDVEYHLDYIPEEPAWCTLPDFIDESPLKLIEAKVVMDGYFDGSDLQGGEELKAEVMSFSISGKNNLELRHFPGDAGPAAQAIRGGRELTISLTESLRDTVRRYQADHPDLEYVSVALVVRGAEIDEGGGERFGAELIFPKCGVIASPVVVSGNRLAQAGDLVVLDDGENDGVIVRCTNQQVGYL